jgi:DNA-binding transcriptional regulator YiaG
VAPEMTTREFVLALLASGEARRMRLEHGLTQTELGRVVGVTKGVVCNWEAGRRFPSQAAALKYGELLAAWLRAEPETSEAPE